jgi:hypothetical protein
VNGFLYYYYVFAALIAGTLGLSTAYVAKSQSQLRQRGGH